MNTIQPMGSMFSDASERVFSALADPKRRQLLATLAEGTPKTATQLKRELFPDHKDISRQGILKHLDLLARAGLVQAQTRGREKQYSFEPQPLNNVTTWIDAVSAKWDARLLRLKDFVENDQP